MTTTSMTSTIDERREELRKVPLEKLLELMGGGCGCPQPKPKKPKKQPKKKAGAVTPVAEPVCVGECDWALAQREMRARGIVT